MFSQLSLIFVFIATAATQQIPGDKLFVVGGFGDEAFGSVEIIDLSEENLICPTPKNFPVDYGTVGTFIDDNVMVCGGDNYTIFGRHVPITAFEKNECYNYDPATDSWTETYSMLTRRSTPAAVQLSPTRWWITGGFNGAFTVASTEVFTVGEGFSDYVDLPEAAYHHNLVKIDDNRVVFLGGGSETTSVWMFNVDTESWTSLPDMFTGVMYATAGLATNLDGSKELVVGPDYSSARTQILDLDRLTWRYGPDFPLGPIRAGTGVPYGDTFLVVGGHIGSTDQITIYKYEVAGDGDWSLLPQHLARGRHETMAMMVPDDYVLCV